VAGVQDAGQLPGVGVILERLGVWWGDFFSGGGFSVCAAAYPATRLHRQRASDTVASFPAMADVETRLGTFTPDRWAVGPPARRMAEANWFLPAHDTRPRCYWCGASPLILAPDTDPATAHPQEEPPCRPGHVLRRPARLDD
jgi:hypothetical protein